MPSLFAGYGSQATDAERFGFCRNLSKASRQVCSSWEVNRKWSQQNYHNHMASASVTWAESTAVDAVCFERFDGLLRRNVFASALLKNERIIEKIGIGLFVFYLKLECGM